ncbi:pro-corazonin-like [Hyposmocoma kahamanoa]|uniref:pro-corazonin-like n=1 Tax=Hyposmocoma kahamanoa TaxID=1477025 RepID=UPI000E6D9776|nr:pro-corazonin-like [Hyposmocoma kahamanoa]
MVTNITILLIFVTLTSVTCQTFQYSRGWTNGKRDSHKRSGEEGDISGNLERILSPCQLTKLKYLLEGQRLKSLFAPCDYMEDEDQPKRYKNDRNSDMMDAFQ